MQWFLQFVLYATVKARNLTVDFLQMSRNVDFHNQLIFTFSVLCFVQLFCHHKIYLKINVQKKIQEPTKRQKKRNGVKGQF